MIIKHFERWLNKNLHQFKYKPYKVGYGKYNFDGIIDNIVLKVDDRLTEIDIVFYNSKGEPHDHIVIDYIEKAKYIKGKGYTDLGWIGKYKNRYYPTYIQMIEENIFNRVVEYCNNHFKEDNYLYIVSYKFIEMAMIGTHSEIKPIKKLAPMIHLNDDKLKGLKYDTTIEKLTIFQSTRKSQTDG